MNNKNLSANTVFHFTNSIDNLVSIFKNGFFPQYCLEDIIYLLQDGVNHLEYAIPMVSFCDIPLSQIQYHTKKYGKYAIGLYKNWAKKNKVNPVIYTYQKSAITEFLANNFLKFVEKVCPETGEQIFPLLHYVKPYEGNLWKNGEIKEKNVRFYDEREWRYVPSKIFGILLKANYLSKQSRRSKNSEVIQDVSTHLSFIPNDIRYLVVQNESEILSFHKKLVGLMRDKFADSSITLLTTKIISMENIIEDF